MNISTNLSLPFRFLIHSNISHHLKNQRHGTTDSSSSCRMAATKFRPAKSMSQPWKNQTIWGLFVIRNQLNFMVLHVNGFYPPPRPTRAFEVTTSKHIIKKSTAWRGCLLWVVSNANVVSGKERRELPFWYSGASVIWTRIPSCLHWPWSAFLDSRVSRTCSISFERASTCQTVKHHATSQYAAQWFAKDWLIDHKSAWMKNELPTCQGSLKPLSRTKTKPMWIKAWQLPELQIWATLKNGWTVVVGFGLTSTRLPKIRSVFIYFGRPARPPSLQRTHRAARPERVASGPGKRSSGPRRNTCSLGNQRMLVVDQPTDLDTGQKP